MCMHLATPPTSAVVQAADALADPALPSLCRGLPPSNARREGSGCGWLPKRNAMPTHGERSHIASTPRMRMVLG